MDENHQWHVNQTCITTSLMNVRERFYTPNMIDPCSSEHNLSYIQYKFTNSKSRQRKKFTLEQASNDRSC